MSWHVCVNDRRGVHSPIAFPTRHQAEAFAITRSFWRRDVFILVKRADRHAWTSCYCNGRLNDTQDGRSLKRGKVIC